MIPRTVPIVCGKSRQKRGASIAWREPLKDVWICATCSKRVHNVVYVR